MKDKTLLSESGAVIVLFVLSLPVLVGLSALALDVGYLYTTQERLNKASRAGAATALNMVAFRGWGAMVADSSDPCILPNSSTNPDCSLGYKTAGASRALNSNPVPTSNAINKGVLDQVKTSVDTAMKLYFPDDFKAQTSDSVGITANVDNNQPLKFYNSTTKAWENQPPISVLNMKDSSVSLKMQYLAPTFVLGKLLEYTGNTTCLKDTATRRYRCPVTTSILKSGEFKPANLFVLLDTSGSMNSPAGESGKKKIDVLKEAVSSFIDMFNPLKDKIAVIPFATTVKEGSDKNLQDFRASTDGVHLDIKKRAQSFQAGGQTNPCDALLETVSAVSQAGLSKYDSTFVVLFTDGAPNVYRLGFGDPNDATNMKDAPRLTTAMNGKVNPDRGWYGWTVKWGERELASCPVPPTAGSAPTRDCDPFFGIPQVKTNDTNTALPLAEIKAKLRLNEDGQFVWYKDPKDPTLIKDAGLSLQWKTKTVAEDNYKWYGPSYLVHGSFKIPDGLSLIDRIPPTVATSDLVTCGPGSLPGLPGSAHAGYRDMYNHSRYFASRVINSTWQLDDSSAKKGARGLGGLGKIRPALPKIIPGPNYFQSAQPMQDSGDAPGCLSSLNAFLPGRRDAKIIVGQNVDGNLNPSILSNPDQASIEKVGEVVKTAELPYYCAIRAADLLRESGNVTVYVIGLGPSATAKYGEDCNDPMQNALDFESRKDGFLRRLAFAPEAISDAATFIQTKSGSWNAASDFGYKKALSISCTGKEVHPLQDNDVKVSLGYAEDFDGASSPKQNSPAPNKFTPENLGAYYGSNDPSMLRGLFGNVAKTVLLRLAG